jgi:hypothetical protein
MTTWKFQLVKNARPKRTMRSKKKETFMARMTALLAPG